jgi:hypothetical protein
MHTNLSVYSVILFLKIQALSLSSRPISWKKSKQKSSEFSSLLSGLGKVSFDSVRALERYSVALKRLTYVKSKVSLTLYAPTF